MVTKKVYVMGAFLAIVCIGTSALAGFKSSAADDMVQITGPNVYASGNSASAGMGAARNSADGTQYFYCTTYTWSSGAPALFCQMKTSAGQLAGCNSSNTAIINAAQAIGTDSFVSLGWDGPANSSFGSCTYLFVQQGSNHEPKK